VSPLTTSEKIAGRDFRTRAAERLDQLNRDDPPTFTVPPILAIYRHNCAGRDDRSTALELREIYLASPEYRVYLHDRQVVAAPAGEALSLAWLTHASVERIPPGRLGFIYRQGRCRRCGATARSQYGRIVDSNIRPPLLARPAQPWKTPTRADI
jgi:hypothetical protein